MEPLHWVVWGMAWVGGFLIGFNVARMIYGRREPAGPGVAMPPIVAPPAFYSGPPRVSGRGPSAPPVWKRNG